MERQDKVTRRMWLLVGRASHCEGSQYRLHLNVLAIETDVVRKVAYCRARIRKTIKFRFFKRRLHLTPAKRRRDGPLGFAAAGAVAAVAFAARVPARSGGCVGVWAQASTQGRGARCQDGARAPSRRPQPQPHGGSGRGARRRRRHAGAGVGIMRCAPDVSARSGARLREGCPKRAWRVARVGRDRAVACAGKVQVLPELYLNRQAARARPAGPVAIATAASRNPRAAAFASAALPQARASPRALRSGAPRTILTSAPAWRRLRRAPRPAVAVGAAGDHR